MSKIRRRLLVIGITAALVLVAVVAGLCLGATSISVSSLFRALQNGTTRDPVYRIFLHIRLPRVLGGLLSGSALAVSGVLLQTVTQNPMAGPNIIGVNTGAGLFVLLCAMLFPTAYTALPTAAFLGALLTALLVVLISMGAHLSKITLVLTGIAVSSIFGAGMNAIMIVDPDAYIGSSVFLVGGFSSVTQQSLVLPAIYIGIGLVLAMLLSGSLNVLALGDQTARSLGMRVNAVRFFAVAVAALLSGAAVSFSGLLGFVGLIIPHAFRFLLGNDNRFLIPASALGGAAFVVLCDLAARTCFSPYEIPVGILMSFIGGPFFIWLVLRSRRKLYAGM